MIWRIWVLLCLLALSPGIAVAQTYQDSGAKLREEVAEWTKHLRSMPTGRSAATSLREAAERRGKALMELMRAAPAEAYAASISPAERQALVRRDPALDAWLEVHGRWRGWIEVLAVDDFERAASRISYYLSAENQRLEVHAIGRPLPAECGWTAEFEGVALNGVAVGFVLSQERAVGAGTCSNLGEQKVLGVAVSFPDRQLTIPETDISTLLFSPAAPSLDHFLREQTGGRTWVTGTTARVQVDRTYGCNEADALADAVFRVLAEQGELNKYTRFLLFFPIAQRESCFGYISSINCALFGQRANHWYSISWIAIRSDDASVDAKMIDRILGHHFGLSFSSSRRFTGLALGAPGEQGRVALGGDPFTVMGQGWASYTVRQKQQAGWLDPSQVVAVEGSGTYSIEPVGTAGAGPKAMRIRRIPGVDAWLWVEYHKPQGPYYSLWPTDAPAGALVYIEDEFNRDPSNTEGGSPHLLDMTPGTGTNEFEGFLDGFLVPGKTWRDAHSGLDLQIEEAGDRLTVTVRRETPCVTVDPQSRTHGPGAEAGEFRVTALPSCEWEVFASERWIQLLSKNSGTGSGIVSYQLEEHTGAVSRRGYLAIGRTTITIEQRPANQPPVPVSADPPEGEGSFLSLRLQVQDPNGPEDVARIAVRISADEDTSAACHVEYDVANSEVRLASDDATSWASAPASYDMTLENSYCRVKSLYFSTSGPYLPGSAPAAWLSLNLQFKTGFLGQKSIYAKAVDKQGAASEWRGLGQWRIADIPSGQVSSETNSGPAARFWFMWNHMPGGTPIRQAWIIIGEKVDWKDSCGISYEAAPDRIALSLPQHDFVGH